MSARNHASPARPATLCLGTQGSATRDAVALFLAAAALKMGLLALVGPVVATDTGGYLDIARRIVERAPVFGAVPDWDRTALPLTAFRLPGYPLLLAGAITLAGDGFATLVVIVQCLVSAWISVRLLVVVRAVTGAPRAALAVAVLHATASTCLHDLSLLTDSLAASLCAFVLLGVVQHVAAGQQLSWRRCMAYGLAWSASALLRDANLSLAVVPLGALGLASFRRRTAVPALAFSLPLLACAVAVSAWNQHRTGEWFFSLGGSANYLRPAFDMQREGWANVFTGNGPIDRIVRGLPDLDFPSQLAMLDALRSEPGVASPLAVKALVAERALDAVLSHPLAYARYVSTNVAPWTLADALLNPVTALNEFVRFGVPPYERLVPSLGLKSVRKVLSDGGVGDIALLAASAVATAASVIAGTGFLLGLPILAWRRGMWRPTARDPAAEAASIAYLSFGAFALAYALVHIESRHLLPVVPSGLVACAWFWTELARSTNPRRAP
jgi:hypothetical protein